MGWRDNVVVVVFVLLFRLFFKWIRLTTQSSAMGAMAAKLTQTTTSRLANARFGHFVPVVFWLLAALCAVSNHF